MSDAHSPMALSWPPVMLAVEPKRDCSRDTSAPACSPGLLRAMSCAVYEGGANLATLAMGSSASSRASSVTPSGPSCRGTRGTTGSVCHLAPRQPCRAASSTPPPPPLPPPVRWDTRREREWRSANTLRSTAEGGSPSDAAAAARPPCLCTSCDPLSRWPPTSTPWPCRVCACACSAGSGDSAGMPGPTLSSRVVVRPRAGRGSSRPPSLSRSHSPASYGLYDVPGLNRISTRKRSGALTGTLLFSYMRNTMWVR
mmetsp:Transcript_17042/g.42681  ORF Transcript_17042/g.42681 Transcript_17042/m.42681 type:complete len:255 (-) Transcript_17042:577-1341(-)